MNTLNFTRLNCSRLDKSELCRSSLNSTCVGEIRIGTVAPEPGEKDTWLWEDGTPILWGDGSNISLEEVQQ